jgi:hypothetical protein
MPSLAGAAMDNLERLLLSMLSTESANNDSLVHLILLPKEEVRAARFGQSIHVDYAKAQLLCVR